MRAGIQGCGVGYYKTPRVACDSANCLLNQN